MGQYARNGQVVTLVGHFLASGVAATGLTVTCKVWELRGSNAKSPNDTTGTTATVVEIGGGAYRADYTMTADGQPLAIFTTAGTADAKSVPASALGLDHLDAAISTRNAVAPATPTNVTDARDTITTAITNKAVTPAAPSVSDIVNGIRDLANYGLIALNTLLVTTGIKAASIPAATLAANQDVRNVTGTLPDVQLAATQDHITPYSGTPPTPPSAADNASAVRTNLATELGRIDAAITSRSTYAGADTAGTTELLTRIPDASPGASGGLPRVTDLPAALTVANILDHDRTAHTATNSVGEALSLAAEAKAAADAASTFNPATDVVAHVTLVDTTTNVTNAATATVNEDSIASKASAAVTAAHGVGPYGAAVQDNTVVITQATVGLGRVMPLGEITATNGLVTYRFDADADGDFSYALPIGSVWTLTARAANYKDTTATVSTVAVS
jgi:hypothetical protein